MGKLDIYKQRFENIAYVLLHRSPKWKDLLRATCGHLGAPLNLEPANTYLQIEKASYSFHQASKGKFLGITLCVIAIAYGFLFLFVVLLYFFDNKSKEGRFSTEALTCQGEKFCET